MNTIDYNMMNTLEQNSTFTAPVALRHGRPRSIAECVRPDGGLDLNKYQAYVKYKAAIVRKRITNDISSSWEERSTEDEEIQKPPTKKRRPKQVVMARRSEDGELEIIPPTESSWYMMYVNSPMCNDDRFLDKFRNRFRLPYAQYLELVGDCSQNEIFSRWMGCDATKKPASPIELLLLGALRYLGRGWTFDDLEESTAISREVHRVFFHKFIDYGSADLYERHVIAPTNYEEAKRHDDSS